MKKTIFLFILLFFALSVAAVSSNRELLNGAGHTCVDTQHNTPTQKCDKATGNTNDTGGSNSWVTSDATTIEENMTYDMNATYTYNFTNVEYQGIITPADTYYYQQLAIFCSNDNVTWALKGSYITGNTHSYRVFNFTSGLTNCRWIRASVKSPVGDGAFGYWGWFGVYGTMSSPTVPYTNNGTNVANGTTYSTSQYISFNISWSNDTNALNAIVLNLNGTNYSLSAKVNTNKSFTTLKVGQYNWYFFANDTSGITNQTPTFTFNLSKATPGNTLYLNGTSANFNMEVGQQANVTLATSAGYALSANITTNSTQTQTGNSPLINNSIYNTQTSYLFGGGTQGDENYTSALATGRVLTVSEDDSASRNTSPANGTTWSSGLYVTLNVSWFSLIGIDTITDSINGTNYTVKNSSVTEGNFSSTKLDAGFYDWYSCANNTLGFNNCTSSQTYSLVKAASTLNLLLNSSKANLTMAAGQASNTTILNATTTYAVSVALYRNGTSVQSGTVPLTNSTTESISGRTINWTGVFSGDKNYTGSLATLFVNIPLNLTWTSNSTTPTNNSGLHSPSYVSFNVSWASGTPIDKIVFSVDGSNTTFSGSGNYSSTSLSIGPHAWYSFANDTSGNKNQTDTWTYNVTNTTSYLRFGPPLTTLLNVTNCSIPSLSLTTPQNETTVYSIFNVTSGANTAMNLSFRTNASSSNYSMKIGPYANGTSALTLTTAGQVVISNLLPGMTTHIWAFFNCTNDTGPISSAKDFKIQYASDHYA